MRTLKRFIILIIIFGCWVPSYCLVSDAIRMLNWSSDKKHIAIVNHYDLLIKNNDYNAKNIILEDKNAQEVKNLKIKFDPQLKELYKRSEEIDKKRLADNSFGILLGEKVELIELLDNDPRYIQEKKDLDQANSITHASLLLKYYPEFKEKIEAINAVGKFQDKSYIIDNYPDIAASLWDLVFNSASREEVNKFNQETNKNNRLLMEKYQPQLKVIEQNIQTSLQKSKETAKKLQEIIEQEQQLEKKLEDNSDYSSEMAKIVSRQKNEEMELIKQYDLELYKKIEDLKQDTIKNSK